jgi:hypothetical protein
MDWADGLGLFSSLFSLRVYQYVYYQMQGMRSMHQEYPRKWVREEFSEVTCAVS